MNIWKVDYIDIPNMQYRRVYKTNVSDVKADNTKL